jgi:hypothetical protein
LFLTGSAFRHWVVAAGTSGVENRKAGLFQPSKPGVPPISSGDEVPNNRHRAFGRIGGCVQHSQGIDCPCRRSTAGNFGWIDQINSQTLAADRSAN